MKKILFLTLLSLLTVGAFNSNTFAASGDNTEDITINEELGNSDDSTITPEDEISLEATNDDIETENKDTDNNTEQTNNDNDNNINIEENLGDVNTEQTNNNGAEEVVIDENAGDVNTEQTNNISTAKVNNELNIEQAKGDKGFEDYMLLFILGIFLSFLFINKINKTHFNK